MSLCFVTIIRKTHDYISDCSITSNLIRQFGMNLKCEYNGNETSKNSKYAWIFFSLDRSEQYE